MPMNATELRSALGPAVKVFKVLADVSAMLEDVIAEEMRLVGLRKERSELDKTIESLKMDRNSVVTSVSTLKSQVDKLGGDLKTADNELRSKQAQLAKAAVDHDEQLKSAARAHAESLNKDYRAAQEELSRLKSERDGVLAELQAAKNQLSDFHAKLQGLKK